MDDVEQHRVEDQLAMIEMGNGQISTCYTACSSIMGLGGAECGLRLEAVGIFVNNGELGAFGAGAQVCR